MSFGEILSSRYRRTLRAVTRLRRDLARLCSTETIGVDRMRDVVRSSPTALSIALVNSVLAVFGLWGTVGSAGLLAWLSSVWLLNGYFLVRWFQTRNRKILRVSNHAIIKASVFSALLAVPWAVLIGVYVGSVPVQREALLFGIAAGMSAGGAIVMARIPTAAMAFAGVVLGAFVLKSLWLGDRAYSIISVFAVIYGLFLCHVVFNYARLLTERDGSLKTMGIQMAALNKARDDVAKLAAFDSVTGLANRLEFNTRLQEFAQLMIKTGDSLYLLLLDVDHFKNINDTLGHSAGDKLLRQLADRLRATCPADGIVSRLGGDEFAVVVSETSIGGDIQTFANGILNSLAKPADIDGIPVTNSCSIGVARFPTDASDCEKLMSFADIALYGAKEAGRDTVCFFDNHMHKNIQSDDSLERDLREALVGGGFEMFYQPQFDLQTGEFSGIEALIRWLHPRRGLLGPADFLVLAEERGMILDLSDFVMERCLEDLRGFLDKGYEPVRVSLNIHAAQLKQPGRLLAHLERIEAHPEIASRLTLEITEGCVIGRGTEEIPSLLKQLRGRGYRISLDDFGTGYASLTHLKELPVDEIKIDRRFTHGLFDDEHNVAIVKAVIEMAKALNIEVVAEGIESEEQGQLLADLGAHMGQGYLYGKPAYRTRILSFLEEDRNKRIEKSQSVAG